jgi:hypothetical protein
MGIEGTVVKSYLLGCCLLAAFASNGAEQDEGINHNVSLTQVYVFDFEATGVDFVYEIQPWSSTAFTFDVGVEYLQELNYRHDAMDWMHNTTTMSLGVGYFWQSSDTLKIALKTGARSSLSDQTDSQIVMGDTSAYISAEFAFEILPGFEVLNTFTHDYGHENLPAHSSFGIGLKYRFGSQSSRAIEFDNQEPELISRADRSQQTLQNEVVDVVDEEPNLSTEEPNDNSIQLLQEQQSNIVNQAAAVAMTKEAEISEPEPQVEVSVFKPYFSVQLGSFSKMNSLDAFIKSKSIDRDETTIRKIGGMFKLSTGQFDTRNQAKIEMNVLKRKGLNGFVVWIDKEPNN